MKFQRCAHALRRSSTKSGLRPRASRPWTSAHSLLIVRVCALLHRIRPYHALVSWANGSHPNQTRWRLHGNATCPRSYRLSFIPSLWITPIRTCSPGDCARLLINDDSLPASRVSTRSLQTHCSVRRRLVVARGVERASANVGRRCLAARGLCARCTGSGQRLSMRRRGTGFAWTVSARMRAFWR
jgi:hypothetical protein